MENRKDIWIAILWNVLYWKVIYTKILTLLGYESFVPNAIVIVTIICCLVYVFRIRIIYKSRAYLVPFVALLMFGLNYTLNPNDALNLDVTYYFRYVLVPLLMLPSINNAKIFGTVFGCFSVLAFIILGFSPILWPNLFASYMDYGFAVAMPATMGMILLRKMYHKKILLPLELAGWFYSLIYSNRGCLLSLVVFIFLIHIFELGQAKKKVLQWGGLLTVILVIYSQIEGIFTWLFSFLSEIGYNSYSINKYYRMFQGDYTSILSGRDELNSLALEYFSKNWLVGGGIGGYETIFNISSSHNIFLDFAVYWGVFGIIAFGMIVMYCIISIIKQKQSDVRLLLILFLSLWFPKLFLSSSFTYDLPFWSFIMLCIVFNRQIKGENYD